MILAVVAVACSFPAFSQSVPRLNPEAAALFERDSVLREWALQFHDRNGDGWLTSFEAHAAAVAFKQIADSNRDGRVSVYEFGEGRDFIRARW